MVAMDGLQSLHDERARYKDPYDDRYSNTWEGVSLRPFNTNDEYLYAMREDLAEWLNGLYDIEIPPESFFDRLESGALLCKHANNVRRYALDFHFRDSPGDEEVEFVHGIFVKHPDLQYKSEAKPGTFFARDNISNFIYWCRHSLRINEVLLFESDDLVLRKNDKSFILCLLEVARRGGPIGMPVPMLVQLEQEIDRELNAGTPSEAGSLASTDSTNPCSETTTDIEAEAESEAESDGKPMDYASSSPSPEPSSTSKPRKPKESAKPKNTCRPRARTSGSKQSTEQENPEPFKRIMLTEEVLKTLDELVREQVNRCSCPVQFPMIRIAEGKYRIGDSNTLIFVRILRKHVMVRVGGGWDTLTHYLDKHDPCRCNVHKKGQRRSTAGADFGPRSPKRRSSVKPVDVLQALNGHASSDGTSSPTDTATTRSDSPPTSPRRTAPRPDPRPRSAVNPGGISRRQSSGDVYRPSSLHLDVRHSPRNSPRPMRRGQSFDCNSPRCVTSPDSSDTYSNSDVAEAINSTKEAKLKRCQGQEDLSERRTTTPDSDITTCSEPAPAMTSSPLRRRNSTRVSSTLSSSVGNNRTSQTATEEFLRRKRQQARAQSGQVDDVKRKSEQVIQSAPASPTRQRNTSSLLNKQRSTSKTRGDPIRRTSVGTASEERRCSTLGRDTRRKSMVDAKRSSMSRDASMSPSMSRRSVTPSGLSRTARPQSYQSARTTKDDRRRSSQSSQSGETVMMIERGDDGRHRLDSESSCESNDSSIKSGSRSLTGVPARRLSEAGGTKNRYRSISVERSNNVVEKHGSAGERRRSLMDKTNTDRKKSVTTNHRRMSSVERPCPEVQPRSRSLSREWQTSSLRLPKNSSARRPYGGSASATGSPVRRRRSDIPLCSNLLANSWDQTDGRDGSISSGASSPIGGAAAHPFTSPNSSKSSNSRLKPPTAIPAHLKPDHSVMTSLRTDYHRDSPPSRIPLPAGHKRLLEAQQRTNSLPDILAELLKAWQTVQNSTAEMNQMDPYDLSPCRSSEGGSVSPTTSVRTAPDLNDSGYEDNATLKITSPNVAANHLPVVLPSIDSTNNN